MARAPEAHLDAGGKLFQRPGARPCSEQRLRVGADADVNRWPLLEVELSASEVDVGGEDKVRAGEP
jgi:hypothetical protein